MRKNVIWIVSALLISAFAAFGVGRPAGNASAAEANADSDFTIQAVEQTDSALAVSLTNRAAAPASLLCAAAAYDKDGRMLSSSAGDYALNASQTARIAVPLPEGAASVKAFVLDASTLKPLRTAWEWERTEPDSEEKVLVAHFSATGTTKKIAATIADILGADSYEITPAVPYTSADLNYSNSSSRATVEQNDASARPAIAGSVANMEQYKVVFLGYPIWWGQAPRIISTFLESYTSFQVFWKSLQ